MAGIASDWMSVGRLNNNNLRTSLLRFCTLGENKCGNCQNKLFENKLLEKLFEMHRFWVKKVKKENLQSMSESARPSSGNTPSSSKAVIFYFLFFEEVCIMY
jgi:hypothetical protein